MGIGGGRGVAVGAGVAVGGGVAVAVTDDNDSCRGCGWR